MFDVVAKEMSDGGRAIHAAFLVFDAVSQRSIIPDLTQKDSGLCAMTIRWQRRVMGDGGLVGLTFLRRQQHPRLAGL